MGRRSWRVSVDGNSRTRYFIDGGECDQDAYIAEFYKEYRQVPTDANITLTVRQEADQAGQSTEDQSGDFTSLANADTSNPGGITGESDTGTPT